MKRNDLNAIITGIVHRYIEDGWVLEMCNSSYSDVVGVHFLSRGRERVAVGIRRPELKEEARLLPQFLSPFVPPHQGVPRQVGSRDVRMEERQALRCRHNEGDLRRGDLLPCAQDRRQGGLVLGHELWKALGASWEGHRMTGGPSLACGGFAACRRYGGYYIPIILAL